MALVELAGLVKSFTGRKSSVRAIDNVDVSLDEGEMLVLVGPSGCGKTTTLRCVAGLDSPDEGRIRIGDDVVFDATKRRNVPPERRDIGFVFQSYALWPHMTVRQNIEYPLRARRRREGLRGRWVDEAAALVRVEHLLERRPGQLSGGQQQRVALARGFVARPKVMLYDEPLSNLDARLREQVRADLHELHRKLGDTGIYVTHDQAEALAIGDRIAVMQEGRIAQIASPLDVYTRPASDYVADFVGYTNRVLLERAGQGWRSGFGNLRGSVPSVGTDVLSVHVRARPADLQILPQSAQPDGCLIIGDLIVTDVIYGGDYREVVLSAGSNRVQVNVGERTAVEERLLSTGAHVCVALPQDKCRVYPADGGELIDVLKWVADWSGGNERAAAPVLT